MTPFFSSLAGLLLADEAEAFEVDADRVTLLDFLVRVVGFRLDLACDACVGAVRLDLCLGTVFDEVLAARLGRWILPGREGAAA